MLFMTYKPKAMKNVRAEQITYENIHEIAATFAGTARVVKDGEDVVLKIATFDGILEARVGQWVVRHEDSVEIMDDSAFKEKFERARNTRDN